VEPAVATVALGAVCEVLEPVVWACATAVVIGAAPL
jgi:hypothetical protein